MARTKVHLKRGMGGSRNGRGRSEKTAEFKDATKKARRQQSKRAIQEARVASYTATGGAQEGTERLWWRRALA